MRAASFQVERVQVLKHLFVREIGRPSVGRENCPIEPGLRVLKPRRMLFMEVSEHPLLQFGL
jgi:hypothetical protein